MKVYNTLTRKIEDFKPITDKKVLFYHCGPTVYWVQHIGNLRAMTWADLIRRSLIYLGYDVNFVRNYTDVGHLTSDEDTGEDKMEKGAKREKLTPHEIAEKYIDIFEKDTKTLNILEPTRKPLASQYINEIQQMIKILLDKGFAYITELGIIFDVSKFSDYNKLNKQKQNLNKPGAGKGMVDDPGKKHAADFNLWVFKKGPHENALQTWPSPWGEGFPGWHIECSVMTKILLGKTIDIHMGGIEHIPVHHTNEIAQSESANGVPFVHYWLHNEHLDVNNVKMAKSQGTGYTLKEIVDKGFDPLDLRYFYLSAHYRTKQNFTWEALKSGQETLHKLKNIIIELKNINVTEKNNESNEFQKYKQSFTEVISNDFQIPQAVAIMWEMIKSDINPSDKLKLVYDFDKVLGLKLDEVKTITIPQEIIKLAEKRQIAKQNQDYTASDIIRDKIVAAGYTIEDTKDEFKIKKI